MESTTAICGLGSSMLKLPGRLDELLQSYSHMLPIGAEDEIPLIKRDLEKIIALHQKSEEDHAAAMVKCWTKEVRELAYDIEDFLDHYEYAVSRLLQEDGITRRRILRPRIIRWRRSKTPCFGEKLRQRLWMANKIREVSERAQETLERHSMYNLHACSTAISRSPDPSFGAGHSTLIVDDVQNHVGINVAIDKLQEWLMTMDDTGVPNLKVVSIFGFGGVGKTKLADQLYDRLGQQFECQAFVRASRKPDMRRIFISVLYQVCPNQCPDNWKVHNLISIIRTHLRHKRYLIIIDDLWAISTWEIIKSALPDGKTHSRIVTTTEIEDLALHCCGYESKYVFNLKPLDVDDSRTLFFTSVFGPQHECPLELREVAEDITRKCCGLPLAIINIASILTNYLETQDKWDYVNKSLGRSLMKIPTSERIKQILNLCYDDLPHYLKACMLYTTIIYEDGNIIRMEDLVNVWIAEGFICATEGQDMQEISRGYFDELVRRKMIQPVDIKDSGEILSCMVHYIVLDLMMEKSIEENFVTAIHHSQATTVLSDKVRRLSLHFGNAEDAMLPTNMRLSQVRTLAFWGIFKCVPSVVEFRLLQVLILHLWGDNNDTIRLDLTRIAELFRLRYLKVASNVDIQLHTQMQRLQSLETLQIDARVTSVLSDNTHLPDLLHLRRPAETCLPNWIGHMTSLRTLGLIDLSTDSMENLHNLSQLTNLQDIRLTCCYTALETSSKNKMLDHVITIMGELGNLRSLTLVSKAFPHASSLDNTGSKKPSISRNHVFRSVHFPTLLQRLEFSPRVCIFSCLPYFIGQLHNLCFLKIGINKVTTNNIDVLGRLPSLASLSLYVRKKLPERIIISKDGFSVLKYFKFKSCDPWLKFEMDSMSDLQKLKLGFNARREDQQSMMPVGMEHLSGLKEVCAKIGGAASPDVSDITTAELAFRDAMRMHARCPRITILYENEIIGLMDDEEEEYARCPQMVPMKEDWASEQSTLTEEITAEEDKMIQIVPCENADRRPPVRKRKGSEPTKQLVTSNPNSDGLSWRKYGTKDIHGTKHQRHFYRCSSDRSCNARKAVQRVDHDDTPLFDVRYFGEHTCGQPAPLNDQRSGGDEIGLPGVGKSKAATSSSQLRIRRKMREPISDGYTWVKYGQKKIKGAKNFRAYFRCESKNTKGCRAKKMVQRSDQDPLLYDVTYTGQHTCDEQPTHSNEAAGQRQQQKQRGR